MMLLFCHDLLGPWPPATRCREVLEGQIWDARQNWGCEWRNFASVYPDDQQ